MGAEGMRRRVASRAPSTEVDTLAATSLLGEATPQRRLSRGIPSGTFSLLVSILLFVLQQFLLLFLLIVKTRSYLVLLFLCWDLPLLAFMIRGLDPKKMRQREESSARVSVQWAACLATLAVKMALAAFAPPQPFAAADFSFETAAVADSLNSPSQLDSGDEDGFVAYVGVYLQPVMLAVFTARARAAMPADALWSIEGALHDDLSLSLALDFLDIAVMYNEALAKYTTLRREAPGSGDFWVYLGVLVGVLVSTLSLGLAFPSHDSRNSPGGPHGSAQGDVFLSAKFEFVVGLLLLDIPLLLLRFYWLINTGKVPWFFLKNIFCIFLRPLKLNQCRLAERERAKGSQRSIYSSQMQQLPPFQGSLVEAAGSASLPVGTGASETVNSSALPRLAPSRRRLSASGVQDGGLSQPIAVPPMEEDPACSAHAQNAVAAVGSNFRAVRRGVLLNLQKIRPRASMLGLQPGPRARVSDVAAGASKASSDEGGRSSLFSFGSSRQDSLLLGGEGAAAAGTGTGGMGASGVCTALGPQVEGQTPVLRAESVSSEEEQVEEDALFLPLSERRKAAALRCRKRGLRVNLFVKDLLFERSVPPHGSIFFRSFCRLQRCVLQGGRRGLSSVLDGTVCSSYSDTLRVAAASLLLDALHLALVLVTFAFPALSAFKQLSPMASQEGTEAFAEFFPVTPWTQLSNSDRAAVILWCLSVMVAVFGCLCTAPLASVLLAGGAHAVTFFSRCLLLRVFASRLLGPGAFFEINEINASKPTQQDAQLLRLTLTCVLSFVFMVKPLLDLGRDAACFLWALIGKQYFSLRSKTALEIAPLALHAALLGGDLVKAFRLSDGLCDALACDLFIGTLLRFWAMCLQTSWLNTGAFAAYVAVGALYCILSQSVRLLALRRLEVQQALISLLKRRNDAFGFIGDDASSDSEKESEKAGTGADKPAFITLAQIDNLYLTEGFLTSPGALLPNML